MSLLVPETGLLFWMALAFGIVLFVLIRYGFPVIVAAVEERKAYIADSLLKAKQAEERLAATGVEAQGILDAAQKERREIVRGGEKEATQLLEKARAQASAQSQTLLENAAREAEGLKKRALDDAMAQIAALSVKIAGKVIEQELSTDAKQRQLIDRLLKEEGLNEAKPQ